MTSGIPAPEKRCVARNKYGVQCGNAGTPFTQPPRCYKHNGFSPNVQKIAAERAHQYELGMLEPLDPPDLRRRKIRAFEETQQRIEVRRMKKAGIYDDWLRSAEQIGRQHETQQRQLLQKLGPEKVAELRRGQKAYQEWAVAGGGAKGVPCPVDPETFEFVDPNDPLAALRRQVIAAHEPPQVWPQYRKENGYVPPEPDDQPDDQPEPEFRNAALAEAERQHAQFRRRKPEKDKRLWTQPQTEAREARRRERAEELHKNPLPEAEHIPETAEGAGGGRLYTDVLPVDGEEAGAEGWVEVGDHGVMVGQLVPYAGFENFF